MPPQHPGSYLQRVGAREWEAAYPRLSCVPYHGAHVGPPAVPGDPGGLTEPGPALLTPVLCVARPVKDHYLPDLHHLRLELEEAATPEGHAVRFGFNPLEFENFSWRGYAHMAPIQVGGTTLPTHVEAGQQCLTGLGPAVARQDDPLFPVHCSPGSWPG